MTDVQALIAAECDAVKAMLLEKNRELRSVSRNCPTHPTSRRLKDGRCFACYQQIWVRWKATIESMPGFAEFLANERAARIEAQRQKASAAARARRLENPEHERMKDRRRNQNPKRKAKLHARRILKHYGLSPEDYQELVAQQGGRCAICKTDHPGARRSGLVVRWYVDHCHSTGRVRGLLCSKCNTGLGNFGDSIERLKAAIAYLEVHQ